MTSFWISAVPPTIDWARLSPQSSRSWRRATDWYSRQSRRVPSGQRGPRRSPGTIWAAITRQGIVWPRRNSPRRGVAPTTTPNQRPRISQPSIRTSTPVSSSRHNCHRSSWRAMPATAARWGRAPASRRAAISTSAGVRTLTTPAWAQAALDHHRCRRPRKASHATATAPARHRRATASGRRKCRIACWTFRQFAVAVVSPGAAFLQVRCPGSVLGCDWQIPERASAIQCSARSSWHLFGIPEAEVRSATRSGWPGSLSLRAAGAAATRPDVARRSKVGRCRGNMAVWSRSRGCWSAGRGSAG
jgi:hypothetical protein